MTEHDQMCPADRTIDIDCWFCPLIDRIRRDEREKAMQYLLHSDGLAAYTRVAVVEKIAQDIEAECGADCYDGPFLTCTHPKDAAIARRIGGIK